MPPSRRTLSSPRAHAAEEALGVCLSAEARGLTTGQLLDLLESQGFNADDAHFVLAVLRDEGRVAYAEGHWFSAPTAPP